MYKRQAFIGVDFFTSEHAIAVLEQSLRLHSSNKNSVSETLSNIYERWSEDLTNLPMDSLIKTINSAIQKAAGTARKASADPYGCFVTPSGAHA